MKKALNISIFLALLITVSCSTAKNIEITKNGSVRITQDYIESLYESHSTSNHSSINISKEKEKYNKAIIKNFSDSLDKNFTFEMENLDSLGNYLSAIDPGFVTFTKKSDTVIQIEVKSDLSKEPKYKNITHHFSVKFDNEIKMVLKSNKKAKLEDNTVKFSISPHKYWKRKKKLNLVVITK